VTLSAPVTAAFPDAARGSAAPPCPFRGTTNIAADRTANLLYLTNGHAIVKITPSGRVLATWVAHDAGAIATGWNGDIYVAEGDRIVKLSNAGSVLVRWGRKGKGAGHFDGPTGIAVDATGAVYVTDFGNARIEKFTAEGKLLAVWRSYGRRLLFQPGGIAVDSVGNVYYVDNQDAWVEKLSPRGNHLAALGHYGNPTQGEFHGPTAVAVDRQDDVYVADFNFVQKLSPRGKVLATWGGFHYGRQPGRFWLPTSLAIDGTGNIYVVELGNQRIQKLGPFGATAAIWTCQP
jgi:DNA-binding beta-propeller fold protein YncE